MPPKPWQTRRSTVAAPDVSAMLKSNSIQQDIKPLPPAAIDPKFAAASGKAATPATAATTATATTLPTSSYSSSLGSYGGGYGGYGGMGGYSSYGGMGGYGGYGGSMYGGGMYGMGMGMGMGGMLGSVEGEEKGFIMNTLASLHSFGFLVHSLGEIGKTLEMNIDGIHKFYESFKNLLQRLKNFTVTSLASFLLRIKQFFVNLLTYIKQKLFMMNSKNKSKMNRILNISVRVLFLVFVISLYPLVLRPKKV